MNLNVVDLRNNKKFLPEQKYHCKLKYNSLMNLNLGHNQIFAFSDEYNYLFFIDSRQLLIDEEFKSNANDWWAPDRKLYSYDTLLVDNKCYLFETIKNSDEILKFKLIYNISTGESYIHELKNYLVCVDNTTSNANTGGNSSFY